MTNSNLSSEMLIVAFPGSKKSPYFIAKPASLEAAIAESKKLFDIPQEAKVTLGFRVPPGMDRVIITDSSWKAFCDMNVPTNGVLRGYLLKAEVVVNGEPDVGEEGDRA